MDDKNSAIERRTLAIPRDSYTVWGQLYAPAGARSVLPLVIIGHGFGSSHMATAPIARAFAQAGIAAYVFDFVGGSPASMSGGRMTQMSVLTEAADMQAVMEGLRDEPFVQKDNVFLLGVSQGGFAAALVAASDPDGVRGLILVYPALVIPDDARKRFRSLREVPDTYNMMGLNIGRRYAEDVWDMDAIEAIRGYPGSVLILHGALDMLVPIAYSKRAQRAYPNAQLVTFKGEGHGFGSAASSKAMELAITFVRDHEKK